MLIQLGTTHFINLGNAKAIDWGVQEATVQFIDGTSRTFKGEEAKRLWQRCEQIEKDQDLQMICREAMAVKS